MATNQPIYHGLRKFLGLKDLVVSFRTSKCPFSCTFCSLPERSYNFRPHPSLLANQIEWVFDRYKTALGSIEQLSFGNEGSVLDRSRFYPSSMMDILNRCKTLPGLKVVSLETRPEYISWDWSNLLVRNLPNIQVDFTVGLETSDDFLRNKVLNKNISRSRFEQKVEICAKANVRLTCYILIKSGPWMTEFDAIEDAMSTIAYLAKLQDHYGGEIIAYLNPTYLAKGSQAAPKYKAAKWTPPLR